MGEGALLHLGVAGDESVGAGSAYMTTAKVDEALNWSRYVCPENVAEMYEERGDAEDGQDQIDDVDLSGDG